MKTKAGGVSAPEGFLFELSGGRLCLDFANTVDNRRSEAPKELLTTYDDLVSWSEQTGLVTREQGKALRREAGRHPSQARLVLGEARALREALFDLLSAGALGRRPSGDALAVLNRAVPRALSCLRLVPKRGEVFQWAWHLPERSLDRMLPPVVRSASELLTSPELERVKECEAGPCGWLFLDQSRNRTRRWCDMSVCGNRAKARRHYEKKRKTTFAD